jgi:anti-sigma B factor antagonist
MSDVRRSPPSSRPPPVGCRIEVRGDGAAHVIALEGELDLAVADRVDEELTRALRGEAETVVLDLSELTFIDSTGIAMLVAATKRNAENGRRLRIKRSESAGVQRMVELTGLGDRLPFED